MVQGGYKQHDNILAPLTCHGGFRSDLLYFVRLAGNYAGHIFIDVRERASSPIRKEFALWLDSPQAILRNTHFHSALQDKKGWFDALSADFTTMIENMPARMQNRFLRALGEDHLIPADRRNFIAMVDDLREYRHWLEHYDERQVKGIAQPVSDLRLLDILGLMILPFMHNILLGRIHHHGKRHKIRGTSVIGQQAKSHLDSALARRREASRFMNGLKRRSDHDAIRDRITRKYGNRPAERTVHRIAKEDAKKRRDLEHRKAAMLSLYLRYFKEETWPRYNYENFLLRFAFLGKARIAAIVALAFPTDNTDKKYREPDFILDIEPIFMLSVEMGRIIHNFLEEMEEGGIAIRTKKKVGPIVPAVRNSIAHGEWFWQTEDPHNSGHMLTLPALLQALHHVLDQSQMIDKKECWNRLMTALEGALRPCVDHLVFAKMQATDDMNRHAPAIKIRRWTPKVRQLYSDNKKWRIERRPALRKVAASWMRDIMRRKT